MQRVPVLRDLHSLAQRRAYKVPGGMGCAGLGSGCPGTAQPSTGLPQDWLFLGCLRLLWRAEMFLIEQANLSQEEYFANPVNLHQSSLGTKPAPRICNLPFPHLHLEQRCHFQLSFVLTENKYFRGMEMQ